MSIELAGVILVGLSIILYMLYRDLIKLMTNYSVTRKGKNWVVRDRKGRFVRISRNFFDILSVGNEHE